MSKTPWLGWKVIYKLNHKTQSRQVRNPSSSGVYDPKKYKKNFLDSGFSPRYVTVTTLAPNKSQAKTFAKSKMEKLYPKKNGWTWHVYDVKAS